jgi:6-phosphogluconolactonase
MAASNDTSGPDPHVSVQRDPESVARHVARFILSVVGEREGSCAICLSGGTTPRRLYEVLASPAFRSGFPWPDVHWFWGDERFVPHDHPDSNFRMAWEALLSIAPIPRDNIHPIPTDNLTTADAAAHYESRLKVFYGADQFDPRLPLFDVTLLGLGDDGHTASLFPGQPALAERERWVVAVAHARAEPRITLTFPALNSSRNVAFLVTGAGKRQILARALAGDPQLPAVMVRPVGQLYWFLDEAAAP